MLRSLFDLLLILHLRNRFWFVVLRSLFDLLLILHLRNGPIVYTLKKISSLNEHFFFFFWVKEWITKWLDFFIYLENSLSHFILSYSWWFGCFVGVSLISRLCHYLVMDSQGALLLYASIIEGDIDIDSPFFGVS